MRFTKLSWRNLFSYGDYDSEVHLDQDGIIFVRGVNRDDNTSNGSGKSTIAEVFIWTLFGKPLKNIPADNVRCFHSDGAGHGCVEFWVDSDYYEIHRYRGHSDHGNGVIVKKNGDTDKNFINGTNRDIQKRIDNLLGLDYHALTSSIIFSSEIPFMIPKLTPERRRAHMETVLGMQAYSEYGKVAKSRTKSLRRELEYISIESREKRGFLEQERDDLTDYMSKYKSFKVDRNDKVKQLKSDLKELQSQIKNIDLSQRERLEQKIIDIKESKKALRDEIQELKIELTNISNNIANTKKSIDIEEGSLSKEEKSLRDKTKDRIKSHQEKINLVNDNCPTCGRGWEAHTTEEITNELTEKIAQEEAELEKQLSKIKENHSNNIQSLRSELENSKKLKSEVGTKIEVGLDKLDKIDSDINDINQLLENLPTKHTLDSLLEKEERLKNDIETKKNETNPYKEVIENLQIKISDYLDSIDMLDDQKTDYEEKLKYASFWDESFNNDGLKLFIFESVIPVLNNRIGFYIPILFDGKPIKLYFDKMMNMTVTHNQKLTSYGNLSMGERKRVDLAIALAMLDTAQLQHGIISNIMFFDEIFDSSLDSQGVRTVTDILHSMPVQSIFVMSHRLEIASEFDNILEVEKKGKLSKILTN